MVLNENEIEYATLVVVSMLIFVTVCLEFKFYEENRRGIALNFAVLCHVFHFEFYDGYSIITFHIAVVMLTGFCSLKELF